MSIIDDSATEIIRKSTNKTDEAADVNLKINVIDIPLTRQKAWWGQLYYFSNLTFGIGNGEDLYSLILVGDDEVHFSFSVIASGGCEIYFYEEPTIEVNGEFITIRNVNRRYTDTNGLSVSNNPTVTSNGDLLLEKFLGDSPGNQIAGGETTGVFDRAEEWVLRPNTNYLVRVNNDSGGNLDKLLIEGGFYEVTDASVS